MVVHIYWNKKDGSVIVPTVAQTEAGYWLDVEPVECTSWSAPESMKIAIEKADARGGELIPTPSRQDFPKPVVLAYSSAKTLKEFERKYDLISISRLPDGILSVTRYRQDVEGRGRVVDVDAGHPPERSLERLIARLAQTIHWKTKDK